MSKPINTPTHTVEKCGNLYVYQPIKPATVHATAKEMAVMCA